MKKTTYSTIAGALPVLAAALWIAAGCESGKPPKGLGPSQEGEGPVVVFDLFHRPLPKVPLPTDIAARPDPDSPTGMRLNASLVADTYLESWIRGILDSLDGWGTFSPISVAFDCEGDRDGICLDLDNVIARQQDRVAASGEHADEWPFANDALYLINMNPDSENYGKPVPLDIGSGNYPAYLDREGYYYPNDPRRDAPLLMFENVNEAFGEDADQDGTLDTQEDIDGDGRLDDTEDLDRDGRYDDGTEDLDGDGHLDVFETDADGDGHADVAEDRDGDGRLDVAEDVDGDGRLSTSEDVDGDTVLDRTEDLDGDTVLDAGEDIDGDGNFDDTDEDVNRDGKLNVGEDLDGDGYLDAGEDVDHDRNLDTDEDMDGDGHLDVNEDVDGDGHLDVQEDMDRDGRLDVAEDQDGDGHLDAIDEDLDGDTVLDTDAGSGEDVDGDQWLDIDEDEDGDTVLDDQPVDSNYDGEIGRGNVWCSAASYSAGRCHCLGGHECPAGLDPSDPVDMERLSWFLDPNWHSITFYEFETNTLILRLMVPMEPRTTYAVVLTDRLTGEDVRPVRSPFPSINHVDQTPALGSLPSILAGDPDTYGGIGMEDVRFAWTFTTQSTTQDLSILRDGLYGTGPFSGLEDRYAPEPVISRTFFFNDTATAGIYTAEQESYGFILSTEDLMKIVLSYVDDLFGVSAADAAPVLDMYRYVDYFVFGHVWSPNFLDSDGEDLNDDNFEDYRFMSEDLDGDGHLDVSEDENFNDVLDPGEDRDHDGHLDNDEDRNGDGHLKVVDQDEGWWITNTEKGQGKHTDTLVRFFVAVPKQEYKIPGREEEPFPIVFYGHGYTSMALEALGFGGSLAKFGLATVGVDCVHHGLGETEVFMSALRGVFQTEDLAPLADWVLADRAIDMNGDGRKDSAGDFWTSYIFHTRDVVRQSALDHYRLIQVFRSFDGTRLAEPFDVDRDGAVDTTYDFEHREPGTEFVVGDYDGDGERDIAGDFNGDGEVDFGGPDNWYFAWGQSLGGIMSALMGGAEPSMKGIAPTSGGGGLADIGLRSTQGGVKEAVILRTIGPILNSCVVGGSGEAGCDDRDLRECAEGQLSLSFTVPDLNSTAHVEFACADIAGSDTDDAIEPGDGIVVQNMGNGVRRCARAFDEGLFRISFPSDIADPLWVAIYDGSDGDPFVDYEDCEPAAGAVEKRMIDTWERFTTFQYWQWSEGEPLVSPAEGYGHIKGTSSLRAFLAIAQLGLEPGDPINYAPHYFLDPIQSPADPELADHRTNAIVIGTIGDMNVPVNTAAAQGRAAGILDFEKTLPEYGGRTQNQVLLDNFAIEANEKYGRAFPDDSTGTCTQEGCHVLFDVDDIDRTTDGQAIPYLEDPLRSWASSVPGEYDPDACTEVTDPPTVADLDPDVFWCPGCQIERCGECYMWTTDDGPRHFLEKVYCPGGVSVYIMPYIGDTGTHGFDIPKPSDPFDLNTFMIQLIGLHFGTGGRVFSWQMCQAVESLPENADDLCPWIPLLPPEE